MPGWTHRQAITTAGRRAASHLTGMSRRPARGKAQPMICPRTARSFSGGSRAHAQPSIPLLESTGKQHSSRSINFSAYSPPTPPGRALPTLDSNLDRNKKLFPNSKIFLQWWRSDCREPRQLSVQRRIPKFQGGDEHSGSAIPGCTGFRSWKGPSGVYLGSKENGLQPTRKVSFSDLISTKKRSRSPLHCVRPHCPCKEQSKCITGDGHRGGTE